MSRQADSTMHRLLTMPATSLLGAARFKEFRPDGWPYCPHCGEEELYSNLMLWWDGTEPRPTMEQILSGRFGCYACGWAG